MRGGGRPGQVARILVHAGLELAPNVFLQAKTISSETTARKLAVILYAAQETRKFPLWAIYVCDTGGSQQSVPAAQLGTGGCGWWWLWWLWWLC